MGCQATNFGVCAPFLTSTHDLHAPLLPAQQCGSNPRRRDPPPCKPNKRRSTRIKRDGVNQLDPQGSEQLAPKIDCSSTRPQQRML